MAGFGWNNNRQGDVHGGDSHLRKSPFPATEHIACRICNKVFLNTHSLINHIETHMVHSESPSGAPRGQMETTQFANPNVRNTLVFRNPPPPPPPTRQKPFLPASISQLYKRNLVFGPQLSRNLLAQQQAAVHQIQQQCSNGHLTKPLIDQLQKKIPDFERLDESNQMLDLTLKL